MASPGDQSLKESLECPVCKDLFSEPKQLECGHTYCLDCVNGLDKVPNVVHRIVGEDFFGVGPVSTLVQSVQNNVQCPQCRKMCLIPDGGLNTNYAIKDMVEKFHQTVQLEDDEYFDGITNAAAREAGTQTKKDEQQQQQLMMCHSCAKRVPGSELFMCKDCNGPPANKQIICALCIVHSHKLHTVVPLVNLASAGDRELAVLRIEEILYQAQRVGDETRSLQTDVTRQFEAVQEKLLAKLDCFRVFQSECRDSEQSALKEDVEAKVGEAIHQCEQLNEHFLRLNELKMEFERQLQRWQDDFGASLPPVPSSAPPLPPPPQQPSLYYLRQYGSIFGPDQQPTATSSTASSGARPMHHFVFSSGGGTGDNDDGPNLVGSSNSSRPRSKKVPPILVAQRRRSRLRGNLGAGAGGGGAGGASGSAAFSSGNNNNSDSNYPPASARTVAANLEQSLRQRQRDDFKRFDENYGLF
uniref:RING-type domain-containing protein n=1 Tax=Globodera rostochiensis TaxID=31243 RepID=A0A914H697_GLORO